VTHDLAGRIEGVLDGGASQVGVESTIVACRGGRVELLRPGGIARSDVEAVLGRPLDAVHAGEAELRAPGMLASHYAPQAAVRLEAREAATDEHVLDFAGQLEATPGTFRLDLSAQGDLREAAAALFGHLRRLDAAGATRIAVAPIPHAGLGEAINDRLARAAAPRS
ncbi:MAG: translation factor Sua5, partial [Caulobacteraceae bacterium]|nr:translation factor Sua5 [Caulobacter sp.]